MKPKLISFNLCPFVQRCVIALIEKNVEYDIEYIDLEKKPDWFLKISPHGRVPVLVVKNEALFESNIILEYLDEAYEPTLHPNNLVIKAKQRAWMDFGGVLFTHQYRLVLAKDRQELDSVIAALEKDLNLLAEQVVTPFFSGKDYHLVDASFAPFWLRMAVLHLDKVVSIPPKLQEWSKHLMERPSTTASVLPDFSHLYLEYLREKDSYLLKLGVGI